MRISIHFWLFHINIDNTRFLRNKVSQLFQRSLVLIQIRQRTFQNSSDCHYNCEGRDQDELELRSGPELRVRGRGGRRRRGQVEARINPVNVFCSAHLQTSYSFAFLSNQLLYLLFSQQYELLLYKRASLL